MERKSTDKFNTAYEQTKPFYDAQVGEIPVFVKANQPLLLNVDSSKQLGSWGGNDITNYKTPLCKIYYNGAFEQTLQDHLGNKVFISVQEAKEGLEIKVKSEIDSLEFEVAGMNKFVGINKH